jgi:hypothetical protein
MTTMTTAIKGHKANVIHIMREDEEVRRTGIISCDRQAFGIDGEKGGVWRGSGDIREGVQAATVMRIGGVDRGWAV